MSNNFSSALRHRGVLPPGDMLETRSNGLEAEALGKLTARAQELPKLRSELAEVVGCCLLAMRLPRALTAPRPKSNTRAAPAMPPCADWSAAGGTPTGSVLPAPALAE